MSNITGLKVTSFDLRLVRIIVVLLIVILVIYCIDYLIENYRDRCRQPTDTNDTIARQVKFFLFNQPRQANESTELTADLLASGFDPRLPTKLILHGYNSDMSLGALVAIREAYLNRPESLAVNVVAVDWSRLARCLSYPDAVASLPRVAEPIATLLQRMASLGARELHLIGFSLGAHLAAYTANRLPTRLSRITGLDPALPLFATTDPSGKLDLGDAEFVDVFHTNGLMQGKAEACGDLDVYFNGGLVQPGCWEPIRELSACSHARAPLYFAESIGTRVGFWAWECPDPVLYRLGLCPRSGPGVLVGERVRRTLRGSFVVRTGDRAPFAMGQVY